MVEAEKTPRELDARPILPPYLRFSCSVCGAQKDQACSSRAPRARIRCICGGDAFRQPGDRKEDAELTWWTDDKGKPVLQELSMAYEPPPRRSFWHSLIPRGFR